MCIGIPMQVISTEPGHAQCVGRGETRRIGTALIGDVTPGQWVLVFLDSAREHLDVERAQEINATLDLLALAMSGDALDPDDTAHSAFELPSRWTTEQLRALSSAMPIHTTESAS